MTIEEIKEWRKSAPAEPDYGELEIIDTLLAEVERLNRQHEAAIPIVCLARIAELEKYLTIATESLEFYAAVESYYINFGGASDFLGTGTSSINRDGGNIARTALERINKCVQITTNLKGNSI